MRNFKTLTVWQKSHTLTLLIYKVSKAFPKKELYGLTSQIRRSAISLLSNISEGCGRLSDKELSHYLVIANGSANELEYQLLLAKDLECIPFPIYESIDNQLIVIKNILNAFIRKLNSK
ncbi:four helix bundle protein [Dyadobacter psychrotolerans]|uniref:Four helix bundle protein n=1 Tax=Dyadobacter psychrotolerans TaxID=2541721 RepID=A0A4R5E1H9_9BACT|nr:four helix bundle protein [Dyadobacter psychrotolerans]TDE18561.1 four helix bundle protein [Dyadobacter psychrotolerans]